MQANQTPEEVYGNLLMEQYHEGKITYAEMVGKMANVHGTGTSANTADSEYLKAKKEKDELLTHPWKLPMKTAVKVLASLSGGDSLEDEAVADGFQQAFIAATRQKTLTPLEAMVVSLLLYSSSLQFGATRLLAIILRLPEGDRLYYYNHFVLHAHSETGQALLGRKMPYLQAPLLPEGVNDSHNQNMAAAAEKKAKGLQGGGDDGQAAQLTFYKSETPSVYGGGALAVYDATGAQTHVVDTGSLDAEIGALYEQIRQLMDRRTRQQQRIAMPQQRTSTQMRTAPTQPQANQQRNAAQQRNRRVNHTRNGTRAAQGPRTFGTAFGGGVEELELEDYPTTPQLPQNPQHRLITGQPPQPKNDSPRSSY